MFKKDIISDKLNNTLNNTSLLKIEINIDNIFIHLNKKYILHFIKIIFSNNDILIKLYKLYDYESNTFIKYVISKIKVLYYNKTIIDINNKLFYEEIEYNIFLKKNIKSFNCKLLYYYTRNENNIFEYTMIFDYLGETLEHFTLNKLDFSNKLLLILQLLEQCIELNNYNLYHNDIKPDNICINNINGNYTLSLIDFGILYNEDLFKKSIYYNTTLTSASPEYYTINNLIDNNSKIFNKDLFNKSQHYAVAGIIFGIFINKPCDYFNKLYKIIKKNIKYIDLNFDICNIGIRFLPFIDINIMNKIKEYMVNEINIIEESRFIKYIIMNMLEFDYKKRLSYEEIKLIFEKKLMRIYSNNIF